MSDITNGIVQAIDLIITLNPEVMQIAALSLYISLFLTHLKSVSGITLPIVAMAS